MPPKVDRTHRKKDVHDISSNPKATQSASTQLSGTPSLDTDYAMLSASQLLKAVLERNTDPVIEKMLLALAEKIPKEMSELMEADKRSRSIVLSGLEEAPSHSLPSEKQRDLEAKVSDVLDVLNVECRPVEVYRMGKEDRSRPRLVKVLLPSRFHWRTALANARNLKSSGFANIFVRRSMTPDERKLEYELRQQARERNRGKSIREWVVYKGELRRAAELSQRSSGNA
ncbi:unnamed protein product [Haemonchus placei]|uniref:Uncharacterized protein n=1 Tax=Haemonchus placei TaxID=6290 RepID=A0A0N4WEG1_HAEPC|nr:unnamed protein product [Haemonchus placei]